jgi:glucose-6-phosphate 1-dehydrogenase
VTSIKNLTLKIWRQAGPQAEGGIRTYDVDEISEDMSFLEMLDVLNEQLINDDEEPIVFDHDCREGICGSCDLMINGEDDPFELDPVALHAELQAGQLSAYGEVLSSILEGDPTLSVRGDVAEQCWRIVAPVLKAWRKDEVSIATYPAGTAGPKSWH